MKKGIIAVALLSCALVPDMVGAGQLKTDFTFAINVGGTEYSDQSRDTYDALPAEFSSWNCGITPAHYATDGKSVYHNMTCIDTISHITVGVSVICSTQKEDMGHSSFFIRSGSAEVDYFGMCMTQSVGSPSPVPNHTL